MNISELRHLTIWISENIESTELSNKYRLLFNAMNKYSQPNQRGVSFEAEKNTLIETVGNISSKDLSAEQIKFIEGINLLQHIGTRGSAQIEDALFKNVIDVATSANRMNEIAAEIDAGVTKSNSIYEGLKDLDLDEPVLDDEILVRIGFHNNSAIENISDFKEWGRKWYDIGRGITMAHKQSPEDFKVIGATRGSVILELALAAALVKTTSYIILQGLKVAERVIEVRLKAEELRHMKLKNNKLAEQLEDEAQTEKTTGHDLILKDVAKKLKITKTKNGEEYTALSKSISHLLDFVEGGGAVDFVLPAHEVSEDEEEDSTELLEAEELRETFTEIRKIESNILKIEDYME